MYLGFWKGAKVERRKREGQGAEGWMREVGVGSGKLRRFF